MGTLALPVEAECPRCSEVCKTEVQCSNTACTYSDGVATTCGAASYDCKADTGGGSGDGDGGSDGGGGESAGGSAGYGTLLSRAPYTWVWQSSTAWGGDAYRAVDGNPDGDWATDINVRPEWHIYTTSTLYKSVTIYNRTDCCGERLGGADVWVRHWDTKSGTHIWRRVATIGKKGRTRAARSTLASMAS